MNRAARLPEFIKHLELSRAIHEKKNEDYASVDDPLENFDRSNQIAGWFSRSEEKSYTVLIGTKLARLATLLNSFKPPNNESIDDTFLDLLTYVNLWWCDYERRRSFRNQAANSEVFSTTEERIDRENQTKGEGNRGSSIEDMELAERITASLTGSHIADREIVRSSACARIVRTIEKFRVEQKEKK